MASNEAAALIREIDWLDCHDEALKVSAGDDLLIVKDQVKRKQAQLWECTSDKNYCLVVTRIDVGPELCIVLGEGSGLLEFAPYFLAFAKKHNLSVRTHVKRKGLIRLWSRLGFELDEYVLRGCRG